MAATPVGVYASGARSQSRRSSRLSVPPVVRTLIVHDRIPANLQVRRAIEASARLQGVGTAWTLERVEHLMRMEAPELVVLDWNLASVAAGDVCQHLKARLLAPRIIVVVADDGVAYRHGAALAGADAVVLRTEPEPGLEAALDRLFPLRPGGEPG